MATDPDNIQLNPAHRAEIARRASEEGREPEEILDALLLKSPEPKSDSRSQPENLRQFFEQVASLPEGKSDRLVSSENHDDVLYGDK